MNLQVELDALNTNLQADATIRYVTKKQVQTILILMRQGLESNDRELRIKALDMIAGRAMRAIANQPVLSTKNLTSPVANGIIGYLGRKENGSWRLSRNGSTLLRLIKAKVESQSMQVADPA